ncbi:MAG: zinc ribbon domain-containing protein [Candidatus Heimdallarchaeota archaeon]|nr:MAG: zinc ribbon domain-containing protein [Candidatus Heimdallarchaeota archaeon]
METKWLIIFIVSIVISFISLISFIFFDFPFLFLFLFLPLIFGIGSPTRGREEYSRVYCRKCGSKLPSDSIYCPNCGIIID